ncbi:MAG TPA: hypothetical protein V6D08_19360, partial [Candidatus Obscuribacterales bacterium]
MKAPALFVIITLFVVPLAASAQELSGSYDDQVLRARIDRTEFLLSPPAEENQRYPSTVPSADASSRTRTRGPLRSLARGVARAVYHAGAISSSAAIIALDALSSSYGTAPYSTGYFVPSSTYGASSCVHGYTRASCPYGSNGTSYGSMYLSGLERLRVRPDYAGGYRYYSSDGSYGTIRPAYAGGYTVTRVNSGPYYTSSLRGLRPAGSA